MPFTAAHPMAVLPLVYRRGGRRPLGLDATCLVIGAMAPDFEYFVRGQPIGTISHTWHGLWQWNLPATLILAALLHGLVKWPVLLVAPAVLARRALGVVGRPWRSRWSIAAVASCAVSALLGAATHLVWDSFTHSDGWGPAHIAALRALVPVPGVGDVVAHRVLQHASTLIGLVVLAIAAVLVLRRSTPVAIPDLPRTAARAWFAVCVAAGATLVLVQVCALPGLEVGEVVVGAITGTLAGTLIACAGLVRIGQRLARATSSGLRSRP